MAKKSYAQLQAEITKLQEQAEAVRKQELDGVISRIREAIEFYGITAEQLGLTSRRGRPAKSEQSAAPSARGKRIGSRGSRAEAKAPKYRDAEGNVWSGRGPRPRWLKDALESGKTLEEFAAH